VPTAKRVLEAALRLSEAQAEAERPTVQVRGGRNSGTRSQFGRTELGSCPRIPQE